VECGICLTLGVECGICFDTFVLFLDNSISLDASKPL
jgi:hypothetical protein